MDKLLERSHQNTMNRRNFLTHLVAALTVAVPAASLRPKRIAPTAFQTGGVVVSYDPLINILGGAVDEFVVPDQSEHKGYRTLNLLKGAPINEMIVIVGYASND